MWGGLLLCDIGRFCVGAQLVDDEVVVGQLALHTPTIQHDWRMLALHTPTIQHDWRIPPA